MKGAERNERCFCGSGKKRKKCEERHPPMGAELDALHQEALDEDFYFHTAEGKAYWANMTAARRRRASHTLAMISALAVTP